MRQNTFNFLEGHNSEMYGTEISAKYSTIAFDYCEGSNLETADLEVIIYDQRLLPSISQLLIVIAKMKFIHLLKILSVTQVKK